MRQISPELADASRIDRNSYTLDGLLALTALLPALFVLLTAPQLVAAYVLGALSVLAVRKVALLVRTALDDHEQSDRRPANRSRRAQSR